MLKAAANKISTAPNSDSIATAMSRSSPRTGFKRNSSASTRQYAANTRAVAPTIPASSLQNGDTLFSQLPSLTQIEAKQRTMTIDQFMPHVAIGEIRRNLTIDL